MFPAYIWQIPTKEKVVYLTFDDGPHPTITPWVMDQLRQYGAKATFFCIGSNVVTFPETFETIKSEGHAVGNHTHHHFDGWKTLAKRYLEDVALAEEVIKSNLFRPPYGKITAKQAQGVRGTSLPHKHIIMWDVLSADYDTSYSAQQCIANVLNNVRAGSIVVFHDSEKAFPNLKHTLPPVLKHLHGEGYRFEKIVMEVG